MTLLLRLLITMRQLLRNDKTGELTLERIPEPILRPRGVVVQNHFSIVSAGTERASVEFARRNILGKARARPDLVRTVINKARTDGLLNTYRAVSSRLDSKTPLGYSSAGRVLEVGAEVDGVQVGDLVACAGGGFANHAEVIYVPRNLLIKLPEPVSAADGAYATLGAIALQGVRRAELSPGESVAVIGLGLVGQLTVQILKSYGSPVLGIDLDRSKTEFASKWGIDAVGITGEDDIASLAARISDGAGVDAVIIAAATTSSEPVALAGEITRSRGRVVAVGDVSLEIPRLVYYEKELDFRVSRSYGPGRYDTEYEEHGNDYPLPYVRWTEQRNMQEFARLVGMDSVDVGAVTTHIFGVEDAADAYRLVVDNPNSEFVLGVAIEYPKDPVQPARRETIGGGHSSPRSGSGDTVQIGLIGAGTFARGSILPALKRLGNANVKIVASASGANAADLARRLDAEFAVSDYREVIDDVNVDLVVAATRHNMNAEIAIAALSAGKDVHVEKPLALSLDELSRVRDAAGDSTGRLMVGFNRRFAPLSRAMGDHFAGRSTPLVMNLRVNAGYIPPDHWVHDPVEGGGRIVGEVCHFIDLCQFFAGSTPTSIFARNLARAGDRVLPDDNVVITIEFADGSLATINYGALGAGRMSKERIEILGDGKSAVLDDFRMLELYEGTSRNTKKSRMNKGHNDEFELLVDAVATGGPWPIPGDEIIYSSLATLLVNQSIDSGNPVAVDLASLSSGFAPSDE
jgi:predicted dehydrogenase/threonine dehydrogenase-like Zn-dependent dehydrogenase